MSVSGFEGSKSPLAPPFESAQGMLFQRGELRREDTKLKKADFRTFYRDTHAVECLSDREKMLIGLTVAMMRLCDP